MPGLYAGADYDLAGFAVGAVEREKLLPRRDIEAGDMVLGLRSSGAPFERLLARAQDRRASRPRLDATRALRAGQKPWRGLARRRPASMSSRFSASGARRDGIKALAHITGGGFPDNLPRVLPKGLGVRLDLSAIPVPPVFRWLAADGGIAEAKCCAPSIAASAWS